MRAVTSRRREEVERLIQVHQATVRGFLAYLGCPAGLLDDLVQDVFLSVLASPFEDRGTNSTAAYLRTVARHLLIKALDRARREPMLEDKVGTETAWVEFERDDRGEGYLGALRECLQRAGERTQEVLRLRYASALSQAQVAEQVGLSEAGVKSILVRARKALRACVERKLATIDRKLAAIDRKLGSIDPKLGGPGGRITR